MNQPDKTIAVILARGGSKGILRKNLREVGGVPLIVRSVLTVRKSKLRDVYVYSDSEEILNTAIKAGAIGVKRPADVSGDTITSEETVRHFLGSVFPLNHSNVMMIQCTTPFMKPEYINKALALMADTHLNLDSVLSTTRLERYLGNCLPADGYDGWGAFYPKRWRRQDYTPPYAIENGGFYLATRAIWESGQRMGTRVGQVMMPWWESIEIDEPEDLEICRRIASMFDGHSGVK